MVFDSSHLEDSKIQYMGGEKKKKAKQKIKIFIMNSHTVVLLTEWLRSTV